MRANLKTRIAQSFQVARVHGLKHHNCMLARARSTNEHHTHTCKRTPNAHPRIFHARTHTCIQAIHAHVHTCIHAHMHTCTRRKHARTQIRTRMYLLSDSCASLSSEVVMIACALLIFFLFLLSSKFATCSRPHRDALLILIEKGVVSHKSV